MQSVFAIIDIIVKFGPRIRHTDRANWKKREPEIRRMWLRPFISLILAKEATEKEELFD